jgi:hypothetical protein
MTRYVKNSTSDIQYLLTSCTMLFGIWTIYQLPDVNLINLKLLPKSPKINNQVVFVPVVDKEEKEANEVFLSDVDESLTDYKLETLSTQNGCYSFKMSKFAENAISARHCVVPVEHKAVSLINYESPVLTSGEFVTLPNPVKGFASLTVIKDEKIKTIPINIISVNQCVARYSVTSPKDYVQQGYSGAPVEQFGVVVGVQIAISKNHLILESPKKDSSTLQSPAKSTEGYISYQYCNSTR